MATHSPPQDVTMTDGQTSPPIPLEEPKYAGFSRFEIELEVRLAWPLVPSHAQPERGLFALKDATDDILLIVCCQVFIPFQLLHCLRPLVSSCHLIASQFVQSLANPYYLNYLASQKYFE